MERERKIFLNICFCTNFKNTQLCLKIRLLKIKMSCVLQDRCSAKIFVLHFYLIFALGVCSITDFDLILYLYVIIHIIYIKLKFYR